MRLYLSNSLQIPNIQPGDYRLLAQGSGGVPFQTSALLEFVKKSYSVFVQTDRAVYNPGSKVLFRIIVLNAQLKPASDLRDKELNIYIFVSIRVSISQSP